MSGCCESGCGVYRRNPYLSATFDTYIAFHYEGNHVLAARLLRDSSGRVYATPPLSCLPFVTEEM